MATPTLRHDQQQHALRFPPPSPVALRAHPPVQQWRPPIVDHRLRLDHVSRFRSAPAAPGPVLPRIASLLNGAESRRNLQTRDEREAMDTRKRKLPAGGGGPREPQLYRGAESARARASRVVMFSRQPEDQVGAEESRGRRPPPALDWDSHSPAAAARGVSVYREFRSRGVSPAAAASVSRAEMASDARSRVRPTPAEISSRYLQRAQAQQLPRDSLSFRPSHDPAERRRLYYHHSIGPLKIHEIHIPAEIPVAPHYHQDSRLPRKHVTSSRYHRQLSLSHTHTHTHSGGGYYERNEVEEVEMSLQKRRRLTPPRTPTPTPPPRQPLYEPEYGLTILETSKPLMRSRSTPSMEPAAAGGGNVSASRRHYARSNSNDMDNFNSPITVGSRISYSGRKEGIVRTPTTETNNTPPPPFCTQNNVEKRESSPLTSLVLKSKEFLKSKSLVRNRHDEIDWVATFLNVGFDSSSIYALMCPLRKGRWKSEEENYTMGLLRLIENGTILLRHGQSIRGYIGQKLHSDDMRVLKKLSNCKMFHFAKLINPRLAEEEKLDMSVAGTREGLERLDQLKGEFLRSVQLEALVAVRKHLSDSSLRELLNVRA